MSNGVQGKVVSSTKGFGCLASRVAIVTGASRGIGRAIALALAGEGASVVVHYREDKEGAAGVLHSVDLQGRDGIAVQADVTERTQVESLLDQTLQRFGRVDILINNAGTNVSADVSEVTDSAWDRVIDVNLKGTFLCCQIIGGYLYAHRSGCIVNLASTAGIRPFPRSPHYAAAKAGIIGLTRSLAVRYAPHVTVNAIAPGFVEASGKPPRDEIRARIPLGRFSHVDEIAAAARFLVSDGTYITGHTLVVDGGLTLTP